MPQQSPWPGCPATCRLVSPGMVPATPSGPSLGYAPCLATVPVGRGIIRLSLYGELDPPDDLDPVRVETVPAGNRRADLHLLHDELDELSASLQGGRFPPRC